MGGIVVRGTVRAGRFTRQEREEDDGRIQSWVLAGERGAAEMRGPGAARLYCLVHAPVPSPQQAVGHGLLVLVDADVFPQYCTILEGNCRASLVRVPRDLPEGCAELSGIWALLEKLYRCYLERW